MNPLSRKQMAWRAAQERRGSRPAIERPNCISSSSHLTGAANGSRYTFPCQSRMITPLRAA